MKEHPANEQDPNMATWEIVNSGMPMHVSVQAIYPNGSRSIPGLIPISYLPKWIRERNREFQSVIDLRS